MSLPSATRRRWSLSEGGEVGYLDLGDAVIIVAKALLPMQHASLPRPRVAVFDARNRIVDLLEYRAGEDAQGRKTFRTVKLRAKRAKGNRP